MLRSPLRIRQLQILTPNRPYCARTSHSLSPAATLSTLSLFHRQSGASRACPTSNTTTIASQRSALISRHLSTPSDFSTSPETTPKDRMSYSKAPSEYKVRQIGPKNTLEYRAFIEKDGSPVSPFHDIPLFANEQQTVLNMVVEIPRWTNSKLEVTCQSSCLLPMQQESVVGLNRSTSLSDLLEAL